MLIWQIWRVRRRSAGIAVANYPVRLKKDGVEWILPGQRVARHARSRKYTHNRQKTMQLAHDVGTGMRREYLAKGNEPIG
jgi:hypothetical protein